MKTRVTLYTGVCALAFLAAGCGPNLTAVPPGPATGPTTLAPLLLPQLDGVWGGDLTLTEIGGGTGPARSAGAIACAGDAFNLVVGETNSNSLSIKQTGTELTARLASAGTGLACTYTGNVGSNGTLTFDSDSCSGGLTLRCPTGEVVSLDFVSSTITATIDAPVRVTSINNGRVAYTYNVQSVEPPSPANDQGLVAHHTFTSLTRR